MVATMKLLFALTTKIAVSAHSARTSDANPVDLLAANSLAYETITLLQQNNRYPLKEKTLPYGTGVGGTGVGRASGPLPSGTGVGGTGVGHGGHGGNGYMDGGHGGHGGNGGHGGHGGNGGNGHNYIDGFSSPVETTTTTTATCPTLCEQSLDADNCPIIPQPLTESCKSHTSKCLATKLKGDSLVRGCPIAKQFLVCCGKQYCVCSDDPTACEAAVAEAAYTNVGPLCETSAIPSADEMANAFCVALPMHQFFPMPPTSPGLLQLKESESQLQLKARAKQLGAVGEEPLEEVLCDKCLEE